MPFPLPLDSHFRKEIVCMWLWDIDDRLDVDDEEGANISWKIANEIYLSLPPGEGDSKIEDRIFEQRVKLDKRLT